MASIENDDTRAAMERAEERFRSWREGRRPGQRIPADLWRAAVELVEVNSLEQVATTLRIDEQRLTKRVEAKRGRIVKEPETASIPRNGFVEIGIPGDATAVCTIEAQCTDGGKLVVRVPVSAPALVTQIVHSFWARPV